MVAEFPRLEEQDQAELFDEDNVEGVDAAQEGATFEEIPDVYDATRRVGDEDEDLGELDAADFEADAIDDEDLEEEDEVIDEDVYDETDEEDVADPDLFDKVAARGRDEVDLEYQPDVDGRRGARAGAGGYEARGELDEDDLDDLGYGPDEEEEEEDEPGDEDDTPDEMTNPPDFLLPPEERSFHRKSAKEHIEALPGCAEAEEDDLFVRAAEAPLCDEACFDHIAHRMLEGEARQEALIDEAVEETFPASDPIAPKHIT
jgi:hypothetical protein